jgi:cytochrome c-type biogenesis protein CcsB
MKKIFDALFSMQLTVVLLLMFALSSAIATFIENDYGTVAALAAVYKATWFEVLMALLAVNLMGNLIVYKVWQRKKYALFLFHISFVIILIGAAITRFVSYEGMMHIREGNTSNRITSTNTYIRATYENGSETFSAKQAVLLSGSYNKSPSFSLNTSDGKFRIKTTGFLPNAALVVNQDPNGKPIVSLLVMNNMGRQTLVIADGESQNAGSFDISLNHEKTSKNALNLSIKNDSLFFTATDTVFVSVMGGEESRFIAPGEVAPCEEMQLYRMKDTRLVLRSFELRGRLQPIPADGQSHQGSGVSAVFVRISQGDKAIDAYALGNRGIVGNNYIYDFYGKKISLAYGAVPIELPFAIKLNEFILDRYPGSNSPSSYASEVTVIDNEMNKSFDYRIFMNNILNYRGFRFYQSSYDTDELGTILSVNHDRVGTLVTYFGYFLMTLGMIYALITKRSRFRWALKKITETRKEKMKLLSVFILLLSMIWANPAKAAGETVTINGVTVNVVDKEHAARFGEIIVLGPGQRIEPMNTLTGKIVRKLTGKSAFGGLTSDQIFLGIISQPELWTQVPLIKLGNKILAEDLRVAGKYASFGDFFNFEAQNSYKLSNAVNIASRKPGMEQSKYDVAVLGVDERVNIFYLVFTMNYMRFFPKTDDPADRWFSPSDEITGIAADDSTFVKNAMTMYAEALLEAHKTGDYAFANEILMAVKAYQNKFAGHILPTSQKRSIEIIYNKYEIFERLYKYYGMVGLIFLFFLFGNLVNPKFRIGMISKILVGMIVVMFVFQTLGIFARWYISGHAPLSNGYESMIFIAWGTMIGGFLFVRRSIIVLGAATMLASLTLFVAHLNWMNPEVTNLVPVLKSVWLTIHVAVITTSYGFLAMSMILGLFNLLLMIFLTRKNYTVFNLTIKEISLTSEATMTIGLYMLTVGSFLGGIWANESWGRYWGWDPKETWSLITILVYAVIIHLNFIPGAMGRFLFNALSVIGFASVMMTYFGVNYYLSGLHSYASGDPVPIPTFVYYTVAILIVILLLAFANNSKIAALMQKK